MASIIGPQHELYAAWFERRRGPRHASDETALLEIADAFDAAILSETLSVEQLQRVVEAASSPRAMLWSNATEMLGKLSGRWPSAVNAIKAMSISRQSHVRFAAICSLAKDTPLETIDAILRAGFVDKSSRVRWKAVQRSDQFERRNLVPEITEALEAELNDKARDSMEFDLIMLRDGHWVRPLSPGRTAVTVRRHNGIVSRTVNDDELQAKGLETILMELRK